MPLRVRVSPGTSSSHTVREPSCLAHSSAKNIPVFHVIKLLLFRPFLLLTLELKRRRVHSILSERNGGVEIAVLISAAAHSIDAAKAIVNLCDSLFSLGIAVEVSPPHFLFSIHGPRPQSC